MQVRVQAIRGLPLFCKDTPEHIAKIVDILVQLLASGNFFCFHSLLGIVILGVWWLCYMSLMLGFVDAFRGICGA